MRSIEYRSMKNFDEPAFVSALRDTPWDAAFVFDDVNDIWCHWESLLKQAIDDHAPVKCKNLKKQSPTMDQPNYSKTNAHQELFVWKIPPVSNE